MLYFSKIKIILISLFTLIFIYLTLSNFTKADNDWLDKKINLGLDLQGGSYLLLEIDNRPVVIQKLQNTLSSLRNYFSLSNSVALAKSLVKKSALFFLTKDLIELVDFVGI